MKLDLNLNLNVTDNGRLYFYVYDVVEYKEDGSRFEIITYSSQERAESCCKTMHNCCGYHYVVCSRMVFVS